NGTVRCSASQVARGRGFPTRRGRRCPVRGEPPAAATAAVFEDHGNVYPHHDSLTIFRNRVTTSIAGDMTKADLGSEWSDSRAHLRQPPPGCASPSLQYSSPGGTESCAFCQVR